MPTVIAPQPRVRLRLHPWWPVVGQVVSQTLLGVFVLVAVSMLIGRLLGQPLSPGGQDVLMALVAVLVTLGCCASLARRDATIDQRWALQFTLAGAVLSLAGWWALGAWMGEPFDVSGTQLLLDGVELSVLAVCASAGVRLGQALRPRGMRA